ncbi:TonB-dependent receptor [Alteromonas sp. A079]|uniref:TonB-dependent receptor n=1 Tax=Alteromonas sp. A079 TaxID=3410268 RepID=UPI003BA308D7
MTTFPFASRIIVASLALALPPHVASEEKELERIIITAQKTQQNLQDVPVSVTALSGNDIINTVSRDVFDLQNYVPAFSAFQNQSVTNSGFSIRGIGTSSQNFGFESSVGLYVDGVYRSRQNALINDLVDIESLEILRGPQGTLFGKNTAAGAMTITSVAPSHDGPNGFVSLLAGNQDLIRVSGATSVSVIDDVLAMRISGFKSDGDGFITNEETQESLNNRDRSGVKVQWLYTPTRDISVRIIADYGELKERCCGALTYQNNLSANAIPNKLGTDSLLASPLFNTTIYSKENFYNYNTSLSQSPLSEMTDKGASAQLEVNLDQHWRFTSISAFRAFDSLDSVDTDFSNAELLTATNNAQQQSFSQEVQLHYTSKAMRAIAGAYYFSQNLNLAFDTTTQSQFQTFFDVIASDLHPLADAINTFSALTNGLIAPAAASAPSNTAFAHTAYQEQDSIAVFAQADWFVSDTLTLTTGLRYTNEDKSIIGQYNEAGPGINGLEKDVNNWPNVQAALAGLNDIGSALVVNTLPSQQALNAIAPFQQPGWGYFFLGSAAVLPRPDMNETRSDSQITGTVKLAYQHDSSTLLYTSFATGFKAGGTNTDRISPQLSPLFNAEKSRSAEIGIKKEWPQNGLRINASAHYTTISDFQATTFTGTGFNLQNAGDINVKGLEVEATWLMTSNTTLNVNAARTLAHFNKFKQGTCWVAYTWHTGIDDPGRASPSDPFCARDGDRVGFEPQNSAAVMLTHYFTLGTIDANASIDYQYTGNVFLDDANDPYKYAGSFELVNARLTFTLDDIETDVALWVRNALNEEYVAKSGFDVPVQEGKIMAYPGAPRTYGVQLTKRF